MKTTYLNLLKELVRQEFTARYRGSLLGLLWVFLLPMLALLMYTFVFGVVLQAKWGEVAGQNPYLYALFIFIGLSVHGAVSEALSYFPRALIDQAFYIKKLAFPAILLVVVKWLVIVLHNVWVWVLVITLSLFLGSCACQLLGMVLLVLMLFWGFVFSLGLWLSILTVYLRDIMHLAGSLSLLLLFLSPVFYPVKRLPEVVQGIAYLNPLTFPIEALRDLLLHQTIPSWEGIVLYAVFVVMFCGAGLWAFRRLESGVAELV